MCGNNMATWYGTTHTNKHSHEGMHQEVGSNNDTTVSLIVNTLTCFVIYMCSWQTSAFECICQYTSKTSVKRHLGQSSLCTVTDGPVQESTLVAFYNAPCAGQRWHCGAEERKKKCSQRALTSGDDFSMRQTESSGSLKEPTKYKKQADTHTNKVGEAVKENTHG